MSKKNSIYAQLYVDVKIDMSYPDFRKLCRLLEEIADVVVAHEFRLPPIRLQNPVLKKFGCEELTTVSGVPNLIEALADVLVIDKMKAQQVFMKLKEYRVVAAFRNNSTGSSGFSRLQ